MICIAISRKKNALTAYICGLTAMAIEGSGARCSFSSVSSQTPCVSAILRKFPHAFTKKFSKSGSSHVATLSHYTLIEDDASGSDDEL